jgi:hypothetical protein
LTVVEVHLWILLASLTPLVEIEAHHVEEDPAPVRELEVSLALAIGRTELLP